MLNFDNKNAKITFFKVKHKIFRARSQKCFYHIYLAISVKILCHTGELAWVTNLNVV